jgi:hypothetical protein
MMVTDGICDSLFCDGDDFVYSLYLCDDGERVVCRMFSPESYRGPEQ